MTNTVHQLTDADRAILRALQADGRITNQQLAERVNMSASACWRRVQALEKAGVIAGYTARIDPARLGLGFAAIAHVSLNSHEGSVVRAFVDAVTARREVTQCYATTGDADYVLHVVTEDLQTYDRFMSDFLFRQPHVGHVKTFVVVRDLKPSVSLPV
ncbi:Lrp/AsnC family transcriptional regulator [Tranquillimonas alkanivorans]|uniref:DNA-binding transcriptional regulator, Lrp family n=1 Tax=Tranquillimonas alkanivorans TaxID=441119 RepID=A0A1I5S753_9RHOB|nr:Lrp/AsnC family transcriptional regulator [Tranquillimonas alkanivorans]SFP66467.1 DNA-binding transcriptional regulator, Lrp family [Tranquillimonas alkanivorans]